MDSKVIKKSTIQQLKTLVQYMEQNPALARGAPVFGATKISMEEEWKNVCQKLNSQGPPSRTLGDWKKTWADLKSRTKKKIGDNSKSMRETGGGLYRFNYLTDLEQIIDRTLCLSSAAAPSGRVFGRGVKNAATESVEECFQLLVQTPPKKKSAVAVITPNRQKRADKVQPSKNVDEELPQCSKILPQQQTPDTGTEENASKSEQILLNDNEDLVFSSVKKRKTSFDAQLSLIRRQIRVSEQTAATAINQVDAVKKLADAIKRLADAAEVQAESSRRSADSAEATAACLRAIQQSTNQIEGMLKLNNYLKNKN